VVDLLHACSGYYPKFSRYRVVSLISISNSIDHRKWNCVSRDSQFARVASKKEGVHSLRAFGTQVSCRALLPPIAVQRHAKPCIPMILVIVA